MQINRLARREFIALLGGAALVWPRAAVGQPAGNMTRIGVLWPGASPPAPPRMESFRQALRQLGFVEGQNIAIEFRYAQGGLQQLPDLAAELVRLKVDVITTFGDLAPKIAQQATQTIPIVAIGDDVLGAGIITSLSRPGGNTTGLTILAPELSAKRLEVLQEMVPSMSRVAALWDPTTGTSQVSTTENAARSLKLKLQVLEVHRPDELAGAFQAARDAQAEALNVFSSPFLSSLYREIIGLAAEFRLPAIYQWREHVEAGGLISYGPGLAAMWRQSGVIVAKVLSGAKPADLPVEQPTKFELVVNARTAQSLGLAIPPTLLVRADEVIE
jgi:putative tryptophan/tyrosine transport system substrate-binding protein